MVSGLVLVFGVLAWFALSTDGGALLSKKTVTTKAGDTTTTEYADSVVIFALTTGAGFVLAGAFFGRLRELKLGALTVGVGELPPIEKAKAVEVAQQQIAATTTDETKQRILTAAADKLIEDRFQKQYWGVVPHPPDATLEQLGKAAAQDALSAL